MAHYGFTSGKNPNFVATHKTSAYYLGYSQYTDAEVDNFAVGDTVSATTKLIYLDINLSVEFETECSSHGSDVVYEDSYLSSNPILAVGQNPIPVACAGSDGSQILILRWTFCVKKSNEFKLLVLRPAGTQTWTIMTIVGVNTIPASAITPGVVVTYQVPISEKISIQAGDYLGMAHYGFTSGKKNLNFVATHKSSAYYLEYSQYTDAEVENFSVGDTVSATTKLIYLDINLSVEFEAKYANKKKKTIIPLLVEEDFKPEGWLDILIETELYYKLCSDDELDHNLAKIKQAIGSKGLGKGAGDHMDGSVTSTKAETLTATVATPPEACSWSTERVQGWFDEIKIPQLKSTLDFFEGSDLKETYDESCTNPTAFEKLCKESGLEYINQKRFRKALQKLFK
ncbi:uncharacterized protein [Amphiura filiformis]|uniref:uncharacterized protein n=1 Tax=Amphiura filiformis TaxID=82378 RepID=UPI003B21D67E